MSLDAYVYIGSPRLADKMIRVAGRDVLDFALVLSLHSRSGTRIALAPYEDMTDGSWWAFDVPAEWPSRKAA